MQSKFCLYYFSTCSLCGGQLLSPKRVQKRLSSLRRASDLFYPRISLSLPLLSLVPNTHKRAHAHTRRCTHNGRTPLVLRRLLLKADEMKEQLVSFAS